MRLQFFSVGLLFIVFGNGLDQQLKLPRSIYNQYKRGVEHFTTIINFLLNGVNTDYPVVWALQLQRNVTVMHAAFQRSLEESEASKNRLDAEMSALAGRTAATDKEIINLNGAIAAQQAAVNEHAREVTAAERYVQQAQASVAQNEKDVHELEDKLRKARDDCLRHRRRKRSWWTHFRDAITKPFRWTICHLVDIFTNSIGRARSRLNDARRMLGTAHGALQQKNGGLGAARAQLTASQQQLAQKREQLAASQQQMNAVKSQVNSVGKISAALKAVIDHVDSVATGTGQLKKFVQDLRLLDLGTLLPSLQHVGEELTDKTDVVPLPTLSDEQRATIRKQLTVLADLLPKEDVISDITDKPAV